MSDYADSLRQQAELIRRAIESDAPTSEVMTLYDVDLDELDAAADEIERLEETARKVRHKHVHEINIETPWWFDVAALIVILSVLSYIWK